MGPIKRGNDALGEDVDRLMYTAGDLAAMCRVNRTTWYRWVKAGEAPQPVTINGRHRWLADDIKKWLRQKKKESSQIGYLISG